METILTARYIRRKVISPIDQDPYFLKLVEEFPAGTKFNQQRACEALGHEYTGTNAGYISLLMREMSEILSNCPEGIQLKPSYGCVFYLIK